MVNPHGMDAAGRPVRLKGLVRSLSKVKGEKDLPRTVTDVSPIFVAATGVVGVSSRSTVRNTSLTWRLKVDLARCALRYCVAGVRDPASSLLRTPRFKVVRAAAQVLSMNLSRLAV